MNEKKFPFIGTDDQFIKDLCDLCEKYSIPEWLIAFGSPHDNESTDWKVSSSVKSEGLAELLEEVAAEMKDFLENHDAPRTQ